MFETELFSKSACLFVFVLSCLRVAEAGTLTGSFAAVPQGSNVNLTATGPVDWVHWGLYTDSSLTRKADVTPQISDFRLLLPASGETNAGTLAFQYSDNFNGYSWRDGTPEVAVTNTPTGVWAYGFPISLGAGFEIEVPAGLAVRTLKVFVGVFDGGGTFAASLSDGSAPHYSNSTLANIGNGPGRVYSVNYSANSEGQKLVVRWILTSIRGMATEANVTLQAAALTMPGANNPPFATITSPPDGANFAVSSSIDIVANAFDVDGTVAKVEVFDGPAKLGEVLSGGSIFTWNNAPLGHHFLTARVTDDAGATRSSPAVDVFVHTSGGTLSANWALPPSNVDLTSEGTSDWAHWGLMGPGSLDHKSGVVQQIGNMVALGTYPIQQFSNNFTRFSWDDGTPTQTAVATRTGVFVTGYTNGFQLQAPADTTMRRLKVYVGLYGAQGTFQAFLSDLSAPAYTDISLDSIYGNRYAVYTLDYAAASSGQNLTVRYRSTQVYDMDYGNVTLQAATLSGGAVPPRPVTIINPAMSGSQFTFWFETEANRTYQVQYSASFDPVNWLALTNFTGDGTTVHISDPNTAGAQRFYRVGAE